MAGIMPDGGIPPANAVNSLPTAELTDDCDSLWHANRCVPRFDPSSANALISEILSAVNFSGLDYDCGELDNLAQAIRVHEISGSTSVDFNTEETPYQVPSGVDKKIGGGSIMIPNTFHRDINVFLYADTTVQWQLEGGDDSSDLVVNMRLSETNSFGGLPNLTYRRKGDDIVINSSFMRVYNIPPGGKPIYWEARSSVDGAGDWFLQYTTNAIAFRCYGVSSHTRDSLADANASSD